jgi:hypothetical protein
MREEAALRHLLRSPLPALTALVLALFSSAPARAVEVRVAPADTTINLTDEFALQIVASEFADLKGFDLLFSFDPAKLQFLGAGAGNLLTGTGRVYADYTLLAHGAVADTVLFDAAMLDGATAGPGILVSFRFKALAAGDTPIQCQKVDFRDSNNGATSPDCAGGLVHVLTATPVWAVSWGRVKTLYR